MKCKNENVKPTITCVNVEICKQNKLGNVKKMYNIKRFSRITILLFHYRVPCSANDYPLELDRFRLKSFRLVMSTSLNFIAHRKFYVYVNYREREIKIATKRCFSRITSTNFRVSKENSSIKMTHCVSRNEFRYYYGFVSTLTRKRWRIVISIRWYSFHPLCPDHKGLQKPSESESVTWIIYL